MFLRGMLLKKTGNLAYKAGGISGESAVIFLMADPHED